ncbi:MAG: DUF4097 family beta strand repeat-containing protein [Bacillota bacterium]|jgi:hypothetical protein|nr:DUF4097 family beta strand repeat-containing protein [Bacillota bacterium]HHT90984.1 DUF4097 family beta strand repeat protein [Bacillota bacterium]
MFRKTYLLAVMLLLLLTASGYSSARITSREEYSLSPGIHGLSLEGYNGEIRWIPVKKGEKARIEIEKEVRGSVSSAMEKFLENMKIEDYSTASEVVLQVTQPRLLWGVTGSSVRFTVYASPEQITEFRAKTSNGAIRIQAQFRGSLNLRTSNGAISLQSGEGVVELRTSNGRIELGHVSLTHSSSVRTSNGRIEGMVALPLAGDFLFETSNGSIDLQMPPDTVGTFSLRTSNGTVRFHLGSDRISARKSLSVQRGRQPTIAIETSNGSITVSEWPDF